MAHMQKKKQQFSKKHLVFLVALIVVVALLWQQDFVGRYLWPFTVEKDIVLDVLPEREERSLDRGGFRTSGVDDRGQEDGGFWGWSSGGGSSGSSASVAPPGDMRDGTFRWPPAESGLKGVEGKRYGGRDDNPCAQSFNDACAQAKKEAKANYEDACIRQCKDPKVPKDGKEGIVCTGGRLDCTCPPGDATYVRYADGSCKVYAVASCTCVCTGCGTPAPKEKDQ